MQTLKDTKYFFLILARDANPIVTNPKAHKFTLRLAGNLDARSDTVRNKLESVEHQIRQDLFQAAQVRAHEGQRILDLHLRLLLSNLVLQALQDHVEERAGGNVFEGKFHAA